MNTLKISRVTKIFKKNPVLNKIELELNQGEIIGILGRNGSGKSTLLKSIFGTLKADSIQLKINNELISPNKIIPWQQVGFLPQDSFLPKEMKVRDVIPLFFSTEEEQDKIFYDPQVSKFDDQRVGHLSLGQRRYLELVLIGNLKHPFLLLDEPFSMIEPLYLERIKSFLLKLRKDKGIILTNHYYHEVLSFTDKNYLLKDGNKIEISNPKDLVKHGYTRSVSSS